MNRPLRRVALAVLIMFGALLLNVNYIQVVKAGDYRDDPRNSRVLLRTYERERGPISVLAGSEQVRIAYSEETDGRLKYLRQYPDGPSYAHITGFVSLVYGTAQGIERSEDRILSGDDDRLFVRRLSDYVTGREPAGGSVVLTVNPAAQEAAVAGLEGKRGAVVALDPKSGAVLAMASAPTFDPTRLSSHDPADIRAYYAELEAAEGNPLVNRAISARYPPGSTFKVITAAAALESGVTTDTQIPSPRVLDLPQTTASLPNFGGGSCSGETSTLAQAMEISCNTAFGSLGLELPDQLRDRALAFGFGEGGLSLPTSVATSVYPDETNPPQAAQSAIGQFDVAATPLQMALVAAGIGNGGEIMRPYLVQEVQAPDLTRIAGPDPERWRTATSPEVAGQVAEMMELVVSGPRATGRAAAIPGVRVAGKTGTAQHAPGRPPHAWFIGFAPADDPQVAVAVVVEDGGQEATGGRVAAPLAGAVMRAVLGQ
jgi:penicillin-binding protein A